MSDLNPLEDPRIAAAVFFPRPDIPFGLAANDARDHLFEVESGVRLRIRFYPGEAAAPNILYFHGNGETARDYDSVAETYRALPATFAVAEYRGYGPATGTPSVHTFLSDAQRTFDEFKSLLDKERQSGPLIVMGRSLGSAPAIELGATRGEEIAGLIIESGFARIVPLLELIGVPARQLGITEEYGPRNHEKMKKISLPTLIMHAEEDEIIPIANAEMLLAANRDPNKVFFRVPAAGHNDIQLRAGDTYFARIRELLDRIAEK